MRRSRRAASWKSICARRSPTAALEVYYQPCVSLADNKITGCEALVRWRHPERGMISPAEFIPIAEETGLINAARRMGADDGLRGSRDLARRHQARGQRLAGAVQERHAGAEDRGGAGGVRPAGEPAGTGDHRSGPDPRRRGGARHPASASRHRRADRARRFRHRLFLAELPAALSVRQDQDRPLLRQRYRRARRLVLHRAGGGQHRRRAPHDDDGGGRRDRAAAAIAARARLLGNAGLSVQPAETGRRDQASCASAHRGAVPATLSPRRESGQAAAKRQRR